MPSARGEQCSLNWLEGFPVLLLKSANFTDADLHSANLREGSLEDASFDDADIHNVDLSESNMAGASLEGVDLTDADLGNADLRNIQWNGLKNVKVANIAGVKNAPEAKSAPLPQPMPGPLGEQ